MSHDEHAEGSSQGATPREWEDRVNDAYFDRMGAEFGRRTRERINWMCSQARGETALDVGCSQGIATLLLAREGMRVLGVDISEAAITSAREAASSEIDAVQARIAFECRDLASLEGPRFDTVLMGEVVEHQTNPRKFIRDAANLLVPGGTLVLTVPFGLHPWPDHKSTILPNDVLLALGEDFSVDVLDVQAGYIRCVARHGASPDNKSELVVRATEKGAIAAQERLYDASKRCTDLVAKAGTMEADVVNLSKRLSETEQSNQQLRFQLALGGEQLESTKNSAAEVRQQRDQVAAKLSELETKLAKLVTADLHGQLVQKELDRAIAAVALRDERISQLEATIGHVQAAATANLDRIHGLLNSLEELRSRLGRLEEAEAEIVELRERLVLSEIHQREFFVATEEGVLAKERLSEVEKDLADARSEKEMATQDRDRNYQLLSSLRTELAVAQYKRSGHYAHLEAERRRSNALTEMLAVLHDENERYKGSLALALGRAFLGLSSFSGIARFPARLWGLYRAHAARRAHGVVIPPLMLPRIDPVKLPKPPSVEAGNHSSDQNAPAIVASPKALSVRGWQQDMQVGKPIVMSVLDEFTRACFSGQANLLEPRPDNWEGLLETFQPCFLFVESAWKGNSGTWQYRVANYANPPGRELSEMLAGFQARGVPTVFWNKEDPVHFDNFIEAATGFDYIFTTAEEALPRYAAKTMAKVGVLQFAADESRHNPIGSGSRNGKVCFAGSFYSNRFEERRDDQLMLLNAASDFDLDIYDRNFDPARKGGDFNFPERFTSFVRGALPYEQLNAAYRKYRVFLNVNSVVDSPTMFSRRIFELLASGTPVVSTWAKGTELIFGEDVVWHVRNSEEAKEAIQTLLHDDREWQRRSLKGIRAVMASHTYRHRFAEIEQTLGTRHATVAGRSVLVIAEARDETELRMLEEAFARQVLPASSRKRMVCVVDERTSLAGAQPDVELRATTGGRLETALESVVLGVDEFVARFIPGNAYGAFYLQDMLHAFAYSGASVVGKPTRDEDDLQFSYSTAIEPTASLIDSSVLTGAQLRAWLVGQKGRQSNSGFRTFASDNAGFRKRPEGYGERWLDEAINEMRMRGEL